MKKYLFTVLLCSMANITFAMNKSQINPVLVTTRLMLQDLQQEAHRGNQESAQVLSDFYAQLQDPAHTISDASKKVLKPLNLIDEEKGKIFPDIRAALKKQQSSKSKIRARQ